VRVVFIYRKTQWVALYSTDLTLSVAQIIEYYDARWKIDIDQHDYIYKTDSYLTFSLDFTLAFANLKYAL
jgi:hypothetical protein